MTDYATVRLAAYAIALTPQERATWTSRLTKAQLAALTDQLCAHVTEGDRPADLIHALKAIPAHEDTTEEWLPPGQTTDRLRIAHAARIRGDRTPWVLDGEREYQRLSKRARHARPQRPNGVAA